MMKTGTITIRRVVRRFALVSTADLYCSTRVDMIFRDLNYSAASGILTSRTCLEQNPSAFEQKKYVSLPGISYLPGLSAETGTLMTGISTYYWSLDFGSFAGAVSSFVTSVTPW